VTAVSSSADRRRDRLKVGLRLVFAGVVCVAALIALFLVVRTMSAVTRSEETADVFNVAAQLPGDLRGSVDWLPDPPDLPRSMEPLTRDDITDAWLRGWSQIAIVANTGESAGLEEYFTNSAQQALAQDRGNWLGLPVHQIGHELALTFYSEDGSVAAFTATRSRLLRRTPNGDTSVWFDAVESYDVVLLLEDGNWRVQHWVRRSADGVWWSEAPPPARAPIRDRVTAIAYLPQDATSATLFATAPETTEETDAGARPPSELAATDPDLASDAELDSVAEAPSPQPWTFDAEVIEADLGRIRSLGVNAIQIPLNFHTLRGRHISTEELERVELLMDIAATEGLLVIVTLFDGRSDHRVLNWDADEDHLAAIVELLAEHPALLAWDLQDNADETIGVEGVGHDLLHAWIGHMSRALRSIDDVTPTTITWSTLAAAAEAPVLTDMISVEAPSDPAEIDAMVADLRALHPNRPILLKAPTPHTHTSIGPGGRTEKEQAAFVADVRLAQRRLGVTGAIIGPLWDLSLPPTDAGRVPIGLGARMHVGLLRADGTAKPAARALDPQVDLSTVKRPTFADGVRKPFHLILLTLLVGAAFLVPLTRRGVDLGSIALPRRRRLSARRNRESEELELTTESRAEANTDLPHSDMSGGVIPLISRPLPPSPPETGVPSADPNGSTSTNGSPTNGTAPANGAAAPANGTSALAIAPPPLIKPAVTTEQYSRPVQAEHPDEDKSVPDGAPQEIAGRVDSETSPLRMAPPLMRPPDFEPPRPETPTAPETPVTETPRQHEQPAAPLSPVAKVERAEGSVLPADLALPKFSPPGLVPPPMMLPDAESSATATAPATKAPAATAPAAIAPPATAPPATAPPATAPPAVNPTAPPAISPPRPLTEAAPSQAQPAVPPSIFDTAGQASVSTATPSAPAAVVGAAAPTTAPIVAATVSLANVNEVRDRFGSQFASRAGTPLTVLPFVERAVCDALIHYKAINGGQPKIHLEIVDDRPTINGSVIADADYKTLRILALESSFPGRPEADPTFTLFTARPGPSAVAAMKTDAALVVELSPSQSSADLAVLWKPGRAHRPAEGQAFMNRVVSTLQTHDWNAEMG